MTLYLGYDNGPSDGGGAQLHRIMNLYCIARGFNLKYVHFPITHIGYKGLHHLENNLENDEAVEAAFNAFFTPNAHCMNPSDLPANIQTIKLPELSLQHIVEYKRQALTTHTPILLQAGLSRPIVERSPDLYRFAPELFVAPPASSRPFTVDIHVRRGELFVVDSWRMLPNSYFVSVIHLLNQLLPTFTSTFVIRVHTEVPSKPTVIPPDNHGIANRISDPITITPEDLHLEDFNLPNVELCINEPAINTLRAFVTSDLFVMSPSSFSVVGAALNSNRIVLYHPFWHKPAPYWLNTASPDFPTTLHAALKSHHARLMPHTSSNI
jgi:hypothetical protein